MTGAVNARGGSGQQGVSGGGSGGQIYLQGLTVSLSSTSTLSVAGGAGGMNASGSPQNGGGGGGGRIGIFYGSGGLTNNAQITLSGGASVQGQPGQAGVLQIATISVSAPEPGAALLLVAGIVPMCLFSRQGRPKQACLSE